MLQSSQATLVLQVDHVDQADLAIPATLANPVLLPLQIVPLVLVRLVGRQDLEDPAGLLVPGDPSRLLVQQDR